MNELTHLEERNCIKNSDVNPCDLLKGEDGCKEEHRLQTSGFKKFAD